MVTFWGSRHVNEFHFEPEPDASLLRLCIAQVFLFFCETCSMPICRECSMGRHMGHTFVYLQDAVQDCRAITIQLLADAQQGRQAVQVRTETRPPVDGEKKSSWVISSLLASSHFIGFHQDVSSAVVTLLVEPDVGDIKESFFFFFLSLNSIA